MALRSMFKGSLQLGRVKVPVKLYAAAEERHVHFRFLSPSDHRPVSQQMVDATTGEVVASKAIRRGFPLEDGSYVLFTPAELKAVQPKASRDLQVVQRLPKGSVSPEWFVRPYYLGPDGNAEAYWALHAALRESEDVLLVHWVMRGSEYTGVARAEESCLSLTTLRHVDEVVEATDLKPKASDASSKELTMARQLVEAFSDEFEPELFQDEYAERLSALVEAKRKGKRVRMRRVPEKPASEGSLTSVLSKSLEQASGKQTGEARSRAHSRSSPARRRAHDHRKERSVA
jgi:DNA end-binding protein Ku